MQLLWASRITPQKQPDLLSAIAEKLEKQFPGEYKIDVYGTLDKDAYKQNPVTKAKNLKYCGSFSKFADLKTEQYNALLYTAKYDGLPNIILEATAAGLPIIASNAGGIGEIIKDQQSGLLVKDLDSADAFVDAIVFAKKHSEDLPKYVDAAQKILKEEHSWQSFIKTLKKDF
jgi:glycosyltransferase involved in cell wall biosynthesis